MPNVLSSLTSAVAIGVLHMYPPAWRRRYADEVTVVVEPGVTVADVVDLASGALDAWAIEISSLSTSTRVVTKAIVAYVLLQLVAFAVLRVLAGPGRFDVGAVWAIEYSLGFALLCRALARRTEIQRR